MDIKENAREILNKAESAAAIFAVLGYQTYSLIRGAISARLHPIEDNTERYIADGHETIIHEKGRELIGVNLEDKVRILGEIRKKGRIYQPAVLFDFMPKEYGNEEFWPSHGRKVNFYDYIPIKENERRKM